MSLERAAAAAAGVPQVLTVPETTFSPPRGNHHH